MTTYDCLIVGAGPVGLAMACELKTYGLDVCIIDQLPQPVMRTKAAVVWSKTAEFFEQMGLGQAFLDAGFACYGASVYVDEQRVGHMELESPESRFDSALMIPQHKTESILREHLQQLGVEVAYNRKLASLEQSEDGVTAHLESGTNLRSRWVVGCDGAHSGVRHALNLAFDGEALTSQWVVADLYLDGLPISDEMLIFVGGDGPLALFPLGDKFYRLVAETESPQNPNDEESAKADVRELIGRKVPAPAQIKKMCSAGYFQIHERQIKDYRSGRVFLAGDAAHVHSPLGGQGMNTGIHDAHNLSWKLAMVCKRAMKTELLETYQEERFPIGKNLVDATRRGTKVMSLRSPVAAAIRERVLRAVTNFAPAKQKIRRTLTELDIHYHGRSLCDEPTHHGPGWLFNKGVRAGSRAPDGVGRTCSGDEIRLHDHFTGCRFHLLLFGGGDHNSWNHFDAIAAVVRERYAALIQIVWIGADDEAPPTKDGEQYLFDVETGLHHDYAATDCSAYLIRPDGYVAHRTQPVNAEMLAAYLEKWCL